MWSVATLPSGTTRVNTALTCGFTPKPQVTALITDQGKQP
jgi:hypothetical protein